MGSIWNTFSVTASQALEACWRSPWLTLSLTIVLSVIVRDFEGNTKGVKAPIVGRWPLEPYFLTGLRFKFLSMAHLTAGYDKVTFSSTLVVGH
jgi:hypothetical protein